MRPIDFVWPGLNVTTAVGVQPYFLVIYSCWGVNGKGICVVKKSKKKEWDARLERLRDQVEYWTNPENATEKTVEIVELFYDCD